MLKINLLIIFTTFFSIIIYSSNASPLITEVAYHSTNNAVSDVPVVKAESYDYTHPQYKFEYAVNDPQTGDQKSQEEVRDGDVVRGSYSLIEPDGSKRQVDYTADPINGFNAIVKKEPLHHVTTNPVVAATTSISHAPIGLPAHLHAPLTTIAHHHAPTTIQLAAAPTISLTHHSSAAFALDDVQHSVPTFAFEHYDDAPTLLAATHHHHDGSLEYASPNPDGISHLTQTILH